jgi:hypothetical protein
MMKTGAGDTHDTHDTHGLQGALFFRVPQQNLSIHVPKTFYARSTLVQKNCDARTRNLLRANLPMRYARSSPLSIVLMWYHRRAGQDRVHVHGITTYPTTIHMPSVVAIAPLWLGPMGMGVRRWPKFGGSKKTTFFYTNLKIAQVNRQIYKVSYLHDARKWSHSSLVQSSYVSPTVLIKATF